MKKFYNLWPRFLMTQFTELRPGAECVNILSYVVTFPATTARKTFFRDSDRSYTNQPVQTCELAIYVQVRAKKQYHTFSSENYHVLHA